MIKIKNDMRRSGSQRFTLIQVIVLALILVILLAVDYPIYRNVVSGHSGIGARVSGVGKTGHPEESHHAAKK